MSRHNAGPDTDGSLSSINTTAHGLEYVTFYLLNLFISLYLYIVCHGQNYLCFLLIILQNNIFLEHISYS
jgi:hypothetical protein